MLPRSLNIRDVTLLIIGAAAMTRRMTRTLRETRTVATTATQTATTTLTVEPEHTPIIDASITIPETELVEHAPGWTVFRNLYMAHGALYIVTSKKDVFPAIRMMTSTGYNLDNLPEHEPLREPTAEHMDFLTPEEAKVLWGADTEAGETLNRIFTVEGTTWLFNDPRQMLRHYYHLVAELFLGAWAFWTGSFTESSVATAWQYTHSYPPPPKVDRIIFIHSDLDGWRDAPGFDAYFLRAVFPSTTIEHQEGWKDRVDMTTFRSSDTYGMAHQRAWHFPLVLIADRVAAFRGASCGSRTQRTASESLEHMLLLGKLPGIAVAGWWTPIRTAMWRYAGVQLESGLWPDMVHQPPSHDAAVLALSQRVIPNQIVITYISRQRGSRRKLIQEDHDGLVGALQELVEKKGPSWELQVLEAETMTKDMQVRAVSRSTIMLGVHGNGLTHLVLMPQTRISTVIELFIPGGFAHDYQWTATALGMTHYGVWNDTYFTGGETQVAYPEGFQGDSIPVYGPTVAQLIEDRVEGRL
ncbi:hypothetical protein ONZ45_g7336 [Pleurotus djamor]|nr:hypothetical protein ONZ45_g7336 [Pleurotus djamor]